MKTIQKSKSSLILIELVCAVLFFAIASCVCVRIFTAAHVTGQKSGELSFAMIQVQNAAELTKNSGGDSDYFASFLEGERAENGDFYTFYDRKLRVCTEADASYVMVIHMKETDGMLHGNIRFYTDGTEEAIYSLEVKKYLG